MSQMIRKQIYLGKQQQALVRRLAKARGVSESELIRQDIDQQVAPNTGQPWPADPEAWERARDFMLAVQARGPVSGQARTWKREDAYAEIQTRHGQGVLEAPSSHSCNLGEFYPILPLAQALGQFAVRG